MNRQNPILLFDGDCKICNFWVQFIQKRKPKNRFEFIPLQSEKGKSLLAEFNINPSIDSIVFIWKNKGHIKSDAAFQIIKQFQFLWKVLLIFWIVPKKLRDWCYDFIAKNRHRFFTTKNDCEIH